MTGRNNDLSLKIEDILTEIRQINTKLSKNIDDNNQRFERLEEEIATNKNEIAAKKKYM